MHLIIPVLSSALVYFVLLSPEFRSLPLSVMIYEPRFTVADIPPLVGKIAIVTGANSGTGKESAYWLAKNGAHVVMTCRSTARCTEAAASLRDRAFALGVPAASFSLETATVDLSSLASVQSFATQFLASNRSLDILLLFVAGALVSLSFRVDGLKQNAGIMAVPYGLTVDGIEQQFGVNHLGHFHLTNLLLDLVVRSAPSRIVGVSSVFHNRAGALASVHAALLVLPIACRVILTCAATAAAVTFSLEAINAEDTYSAVGAYARSKLANVLHIRKLAKRLEGTAVYANVVHPGFVATGIADSVRARGSLYTQVVDFAMTYFAFDVTRGSTTHLYCATSPKIETDNVRGAYFVPIAAVCPPTAQAQNDALADELWDFSANFIRSKGF